MNEWPLLTLGQVCADGGGFVRTGPFGSQLHRRDYTDDPAGIPVVMPKDMADGRVVQTSIARIGQGTADRLCQHLLAPGDIALSRRGDVGRSAWITPADVPILCGTGTMRIHLGTPRSVRPGYLRYFLRSRLAIDYLEGQAVGATMPNLNAGIVEAMPIPLLPIEVQDSAAEVLSAIDDLIDNNRRRVAVLEEMARSIYREWFVHFRFPGHEDTTFVDSPLGPLPGGWAARQLEEVAVLVRGRAYRRNELVAHGGHPFINLKCMMRGGGFRRDGLKRYDGRYTDDQLAAAGDIVLAVTDLTQGREILARATLVPSLGEERGVISLDVARIAPKDPTERLWIFAALRWSDFSDRVKEYANGATVLHLSPAHVSSGLIIWPPGDLRSRFVEVADATLTSVDVLQESSDRLARIRDSLLPKLVAGQIDVSSLYLEELVDGAVA
jgi:type I restriction enzyme, S subunit